MKSKTFVMMFVAIGCGLVAAYLTARISAKQAVPDSVPVLVAKERIRAGEVIKEPEKLFVEMRYPAGTTPNAIGFLDDLKGKMTNKTIQPGQWLTQDDLSSNFGIELPKGYYAMSVKVDAAQAGSGFILPKSRVNVVACIKDRNGNGKPRVMTVLQDVLVLAVDAISVRPEDKMAVPQLQTALLAVKPSESQRLTLAQNLAGGDLRLVLRAHDDEAKPPLPPLSDLDVNAEAPGETNDPTGHISYRLAVAKQDIEANTEIDDPDKFFKVDNFPVAPEKAIAADALDSLKGKVIQHALFKDGILTSKHFTGDVALAKAQKSDVNRHVMYIQNGGQAPLAVTFENGIAVLGESKNTLLTSPPKPETPAKPEEPQQPPKPETPTKNGEGKPVQG
jgi:Flp pilus assembly protein CpaB